MKTTLCKGLVGSTAYGLATEQSDRDYLGVYAESTRDILGVDGHSLVKNSVVQKDPDFTMHELSKFFALALSANPTVLETLFLNEYEILDDTFKEVVDNRDIFLGADKIRSAYYGYVSAQAKRLTNRIESGTTGFDPDLRKRTKKHARHCRRLLLQGYELLTTGEITIDVSPYREEIFEYGEVAERDPETFSQMVEEELARLKEATVVIPNEANREEASELLQEIRLELLSRETTQAIAKSMANHPSYKEN